MEPTAAYVDLIMTPVNVPGCLAANTRIFELFKENGFDVSAVANALGRWLCYGPVDTLYIQGYNADVGRCAYEDFKAALRFMPEITPLEGTADVLRVSGKKLVLLNPFANVPTLPPRHVIFRFMNMIATPKRFSLYSLASFVACGNTENGPVEKYQCMEENGYLCVKAQFSNELPCGRCFSMGRKGRLRQTWFPSDWRNFVDEGVVCEPLGMCKEVYMWTPDSDQSDDDD